METGIMEEKDRKETMMGKRREGGEISALIGIRGVVVDFHISCFSLMREIYGRLSVLLSNSINAPLLSGNKGCGCLSIQILQDCSLTVNPNEAHI